ncbi:Eukaryotic translation initiation factor 2-alpha kinase 4 [Phytophthora nicotianae]|uniref:Eukaryotic translation initiation factor 2-alpha kinase 4 n=2 Tax=Phytophthora nicotianae TaxID=4792 RepID=A0A0W8DKG6_PHYNI|nr:Eukaryotic translation initiation factor 2-alpha kinase 4 [Phytophthora nicotianae]
MAKIAIIYYSTYGHIAQLAEAAKKGVESVDGVTAEIYQVQETLSDEILGKMHAAPKKDHPIATVDTLKEADGILFGFPTRFGSLPAQVKALFDSAGGLTGTQGGGQETTAFTALTFLAHQGLTFVPLGYRAPELFNMDEIHGGSPWGAGTLAGNQGGGQETTAFTALTFLAHQGLTFVPLGYRAPELFNMDEIHGGSPWGAGTLAGGDGSRQPSKLELTVATTQGKSFAEVAKKLSS